MDSGRFQQPVAQGRLYSQSFQAFGNLFSFRRRHYVISRIISYGRKEALMCHAQLRTPDCPMVAPFRTALTIVSSSSCVYSTAARFCSVMKSSSGTAPQQREKGCWRKVSPQIRVPPSNRHPVKGHPPHVREPSRRGCPCERDLYWPRATAVSVCIPDWIAEFAPCVYELYWPMKSCTYTILVWISVPMVSW